MTNLLPSYSSLGTAWALFEDARALSAAGQALEAELLCREAVVAIEEVFGTLSVEQAEARMFLAELRFQDGDAGEALEHLRMAIQTLCRLSEQNEQVNRLRVQALGREGLIRVMEGAPEEGLPLLRQALLRARRQLGSRDPEVLCCLNALAFASRRQGRHDLAASQLRQALQSCAGANPVQVAMLHRNLARLELDRGRLAHGEPHARTAVALLQRAGLSAASEQALLAHLLRRRNPGEAEALARCALPGLEGEERTAVCHLLADLLADREEMAQAEVYRWSAEAA